MGRSGHLGAVRQVDDLEELDIGIQAMAQFRLVLLAKALAKAMSASIWRCHLLLRRPSLCRQYRDYSSEDPLDIE